MRSRFPQALTAVYVFLVSLLAIAMSGAVLAQARGDVNCDGQRNRDDLTALIAVLFGDVSSDCGAADVNADGRVAAADVIALAQTLDPPTGPLITFLGLAGADGKPTTPLGMINGTPVYFRNTGSGFQLVVEARAGPSGQQPGAVTFNTNPRDPSRRPDIQIESSAPLGDGSLAVCDGGVPAISPPDFGLTQAVANALNDLTCRFPAAATSPNSSCTLDSFGRPAFMGTATQIQLCLLVSRSLEVPTGQTTLSARWRDTAGNLGPMQQLILQVGAGPVPPTFTSSPTLAPTRTTTSTVISTATPTLTRTATRGRTPTPSHTATVTQLVTRTNTRPAPTATATPTQAAAVSPTPTPIVSATRTATRPVIATSSTTPTRTPTTPAPPSASATRSATRSPTAATSTATTTSSRTPTVTRTHTPLPTMTRTPTSTRTRTATRTATSTPVGPTGPVISFFGVTRADDTLVASSGTTPDGVPVYERSSGAGFSLVVEGQPGPSGSPVGRSAFASNGTSFPDLQVEVSRPLGDGSAAICDRSGPTAGGVPAIDPPSFDDTPAVIATANDLSCRFVNGSDMPVARGSDEACIMFANGDLHFANPASTVEFCGFITRFMEFPLGDTLVTARLRDQDGNVGTPGQIVVRVGP